MSLPPRTTRPHSNHGLATFAAVVLLPVLLALPASALGVPAAVDQYREQPPPAGPGGFPDSGGGLPARGGDSDSGTAPGGGGTAPGGGPGGGAGPAPGTPRPDAIAALGGASEAGEAGGSTLPLTGYRVTPFVLWIVATVFLLLLARVGWIAFSRLRPGPASGTR